MSPVQAHALYTYLTGRGAFAVPTIEFILECARQGVLCPN